MHNTVSCKTKYYINQFLFSILQKQMIINICLMWCWLVNNRGNITGS